MINYVFLMLVVLCYSTLTRAHEFSPFEQGEFENIALDLDLDNLPLEKNSSLFTAEQPPGNTRGSP